MVNGPAQYKSLSDMTDKYTWRWSNMQGNADYIPLALSQSAHRSTYRNEPNQTISIHRYIAQ